MTSFVFTSESVTEGHPDKICDQISDGILDALLEEREDISVVVDIDWRGYYVGRKDHPISEAENVIFNLNNEVEKIGISRSQRALLEANVVVLIFDLSNGWTKEVQHLSEEIPKNIPKIFFNKCPITKPTNTITTKSTKPIS